MSAPQDEQRAEKARERTAAIRALVSLVLFAFIGTQIAGNRASTATAAVTYVVVLAISVLLHEAGHAVAVKAVGGDLLEFRLGFGPPVLRGRIRRTNVDIRPLVIAGHVGWKYPPGVRRRQLFAVSAAGPAMHVVLIAVALTAGSGEWSVWRIDLLIANLSALVSNVLPMYGGLMTTAGGPNDGATMAGLLRGNRPQRVRAPLGAPPHEHAAALSASGIAALREGRLDLAEALLRQALSIAPDDPSTRAFAHEYALTPR